VPDSAINSWVYNGHLKVAARGDRVQNGKPANLYRIGDIIALAERFIARRKARPPVVVRLHRPLISAHDEECLAARW
jgi:hypothetical protein